MSIRLSLVMVAALLGACKQSSRLPEFELQGVTMGTMFSVKLIALRDEVSTDALGEQIRDRLDHIDQVMSTYIAQSELSLFNAIESTNWHEVSLELCTAVEQTLEISKATDGAFDVTVGPLVNLWGFGPDDVIAAPPDQARLDAALSIVGFESLQARCSTPALRKAKQEIQVDLSGWAKGYAVDELALLLDENHITDYLVEIGGELRARGLNAEQRKWAVAIEQPLVGVRRAQTVLRLTNYAVATSGDYRNFFEYQGQRFSHTIDGRIGWPVSHDLAAVTIVNKSAAYADAMATALLVLGPKSGPALAEKLEIAALFLVRDEGGLFELTTSNFDGLNLR
jgi:thiamine biosynthesis lipoprotein